MADKKDKEEIEMALIRAARETSGDDPAARSGIVVAEEPAHPRRKSSARGHHGDDDDEKDIEVGGEPQAAEEEGANGEGDDDHKEAHPKPVRRFPFNVLFATWDLLRSNKLNILLIALPFSFIAYLANWGNAALFIFSMISIIPLAWLLGESTEELALRTNDTIGGFLNATFGNAVELIVSIFALRRGLIRVVQASLLGSIISNLLLVLGFSFLCGGLKFKQQKFSAHAARTGGQLLLLEVLCLMIPAAFVATVAIDTNKSILQEAEDSRMLWVSHWTSIMLFIIYVLFLVFQMKTHKHLFEEEDDEEDEEPKMSLAGALVLLAVTTIVVSVEADFVVDTIKEVAAEWNISQTFIGIILIPIVGNAAEHVTAVKVAVKNKMDLAIGVVFGSASQIAVLVIPVCTLLGWAMGQPMSLYFRVFETVILLTTVLIVNAVVFDGSSNWLEGACLLAAYIVIAIAFLYLPPEEKFELD